MTSQPLEVSVVISDAADPISAEEQIFKRVTKTSLLSLQARIAQDVAKKKEEKHRRLVEQIFFTKPFKSLPDENFLNGEPLSAELQDAFPPDCTSEPLLELDPYYAKEGQQTFLVVNRRKTLYRFSSEKTFFVFGPLHPIRKVALAVACHPLTALLMLLVIQLHTFSFMTMDLLWRTTPLSEYVFTSFYAMEFCTNVIARGVIMHPHSYLRDPWGIWEFILLVLAFIPPYDMSFAALRGFRIVRLLQEFYPYSGGAEVARAITRSLRALAKVLPFTGAMVFLVAALFLQMFGNTMTNRCFKDLVGHNIPWPEREYLCGNTSGSSVCPDNYTCMSGLAEEPDGGYFTFQSIGLSILQAIRILTRDFPFEQVVRTSGPVSTLITLGLGLIILPFGVFYLGVATVIQAVSDAKQWTDKLRSRQQGTPGEGALCGGVKNKIHPAKETPSDSENEPENEITMSSVTRPKAAKSRQTKDENQDLIKAKGTTSDNIFMKKARIIQEKSAPVTNCLNKYCCYWSCCPCCTPFQTFLVKVVEHPVFLLVIGIVVFFDCICMALDHHDMDFDFYTFLKNAHYAVVMIYFAEFLLKMLAYAPRRFFQSGWRRLEFFIVLFALLELALENVSGLSILRIFRIFVFLRIFILWIPGYKCLTFLWKMVGWFSWLMTIMLFFIISIAVTLMKRYSHLYVENKEFIGHEFPRWSTADATHSFYFTFRLSWGEWWDEQTTLLRVRAPFDGLILATVFLLYWLFSQLFLAAVVVYCRDGEDNPQAEKNAFGRWSRATAPLCKLMGIIGNNLSRKKAGKEKINSTKTGERNGSAEDVPRLKEIPGTGKVNDIRQNITKYVHSVYFEIVICLFITAFIAILIIFKNKSDRDAWIDYTLGFILVIFVIEMILRLVEKGFVGFCQDYLCILDWFAVTVSLIAFMGDILGEHSFYLFLPCSIVLRVVRVFNLPFSYQLKRSARIVFQSVPVMIIIASFWFVYAVVGTQMLAGKFFRCVDKDNTILGADVIRDKQDCLIQNYTWVDGIANFDNVRNSFISLQFIATFEGWMGIFNTAVDSRDIDMQPIREVNIYLGIYLFHFLIVAVYTVARLFFVVVVKEIEVDTKDLEKTGEIDCRFKRWRKQLQFKNSVCYSVHKVKIELLQRVLNFVATNTYEWLVLIFLLVCVILTCVFNDHRYVLAVNVLFLIVTIADLSLRIVLRRCHFFKSVVNVLDLAFLILCVIDAFALPMDYTYLTWPTLRLLLRSVHVDILLRNVRGAKPTRVLLSTLKSAAPSVAALYVQLLTTITIYAVVGIYLFDTVRTDEKFTGSLTFKNFQSAFTVLSMSSALIGWDWVYTALSNEEDCYLADPSIGQEGTCGDLTTAIIYIFSFLYFSFVLVYSQILITIWQHYKKALLQEEQLITPIDIRVVQKTWKSFSDDEKMKVEHLEGFLDALEAPLRLPKPNHDKVASLDIPVQENDVVEYWDVAHAVLRDVLLRQALFSPEDIEAAVVNSKAATGSEATSHAASSNEEKEEKSARIIQKAWKNSRNNKAAATAATAEEVA